MKKLHTTSLGYSGMDRPAQLIVWPGKPYPLGANWDGEGANFALFAEHAERVELCWFDETGRRELHRVRLTEQTDLGWPRHSV